MDTRQHRDFTGPAVPAPSTDPAYERPIRLLTSYPFPFRNVPQGHGMLRLPADLTQQEADRIKVLLDTLVVARGGAPR
jgi:hypothetical protein